MEQELWQRCLQIISENVSQHAFDVWFKDITLESYDPDKRTVLLSVPHRYVYEYLEEVQAPLLKQAIEAAFGPKTRLNYRVYKEQVAAIPAFTFPAVGRIPRFSVPSARECLQRGLRHYLGDKAQWIDGYDRISGWLADNRGRGLLCFGTSGLGKTLICEKIIPAILGRGIKTVASADMYGHIDELLRERCLIVDDLGKEPACRYGQPDTSFFRLCDNAEKNGNLLIITTNLSTTPTRNNPLYSLSIQERYGNEVLDRLRAITTVAQLTGDSMRR